MKRSKKKGLHPKVILIIAVVIVAVGYFGLTAMGFRFGMRQVTSFKADGICLPVTDPKCGYCPGEVTKDEKCYVKYGELKQYP